jgi:5'-nucleotidase
MKRGLAALGVALVLVAGCGSDDDAGSDVGESGTTTTTEAPSSSSSPSTSEVDAQGAPLLSILVTNDDGYAAEGIDAVVEALVAEGHDVQVVAPLEQQSGTGGTFTEGAVESQEELTAGGHPAIAVAGYPADSVRVAIDEMEIAPDLVVSGINEGQNVGAVVDASGTIGAARAAVARGIPALALSASFGPFAEGYEVGTELMLAWLDEHAAALAAGEAPIEVTSINAPSCAEGEPKELVEVAVATDGDPLAQPDCTSDLADPTTDVEALTAGFPTLTVVPAEPATPPQPG